ncbi:ATP-binding protein [Nocardioides sp. CFH 31398]|uniref:ATP-binding protein n=1 Tax=Nocardioides sp. CFH 31398 TaxID=2919579 RepID=UPI001F0696B5|nr:anti-sigma factor [Nocardioides sp. CFH 31398]MCH1866616.1 anti-sigma factor [Nocardioides sp. CFH 31398]
MTHTGVPTGTTLTGEARPDVELRVPADGAFVSVVRTATAGLAARLDFPIDDIEDLRIAVSEACALLLESARPGADLHCAFSLTPGLVRVSISLDGAEGAQAPDREGFAWQVLSTLASDADTWAEGDRVTVALTLESSATS